jgi:hypothetical protein
MSACCLCGCLIAIGTTITYICGVMYPIGLALMAVDKIKKL